MLSTGKRSNKICMTVSTVRKTMSYKDIWRKVRVVSNNIRPDPIVSDIAGKFLYGFK